MVPAGALAVGTPATIKEGRARREDIEHGVASYVERAAAIPRRAATHRLVLALVVSDDCRRGRARLRRAVVARCRCHRGAPGRGRQSSCGPRSATTSTRSPMPPSCDSDRWPWRIVEVDETVADTWREHATPVVHRRRSGDLSRRGWRSTPTPGVTVLRIEPGSTFGLGDHPTTMLSMRALRAALLRRAQPCSMWDAVRGVLAVGACVLRSVARDRDRHLAGVGADHARQRMRPTVLPIASTSRRRRWRRSMGSFDIVRRQHPRADVDRSRRRSPARRRTVGRADHQRIAGRPTRPRRGSARSRCGGHDRRDPRRLGRDHADRAGLGLQQR